LTAVGAEEKSAGGQTQAQTGPVEQTAAQSRNLSREEMARIRQKWANMSDEERTQARAKIRQQLAGSRPALGAVQEKSIAEQIATFKQDHQAVMTELQNIRQLAAKEKAGETIKALDALIARRERAYQEKLQLMERRSQRIQAAQKGAGSTAPRTDANEPPAKK
jgi:hypothetical protein